MTISIERVKELLEYSEDTLRWKVQRGCSMKGAPAGTINRNHLYVFLDKQRIRVDWCVWVLTRGELPVGSIIHIDGNKLNCSQENLQDDLKPVSATPLRPGISFLRAKQKWQVDVKVKGVKHRVGTFSDEKEATLEYDKAILILAAGGALARRPRSDKRG